MKFYLAPMEGITGYIYRQAYNSCFKPMDRYFTPFLAPKHKSGFSSKELNDILPEHNQGMEVIPQILTSDPEDFLDTAVKLKEYGYTEVNLNLGCPSGTVAAKGKGAGFLKDTEKLARFLGEVSEGMERENLHFSIKTRVGVESEEEFQTLLGLYNQCPLTELIIHPRVLKDFYKYNVRMNAFKEGFEKSRHSVCYNGDIFRRKDYDRLVKDYIKTGMSVNLDQWGTSAFGTVETVSLSSTVNNGVASYPITISADNTEGNLQVNSYVNYKIMASQNDNCLMVPIQAVRTVGLEDGSSATVVYVQADSRPDNALELPYQDEEIPSGFYPVQVEIGIQDTYNVEIKSGVNDGDTVFTQMITDQAWG